MSSSCRKPSCDVAFAAQNGEQPVNLRVVGGVRIMSIIKLKLARSWHVEKFVCVIGLCHLIVVVFLLLLFLDLLLDFELENFFLLGFNNSQRQQCFDVRIINDGEFETDVPESIVLQVALEVGSPLGVAIADSSSNIEILVLDDDAQPTTTESPTTTDAPLTTTDAPLTTMDSPPMTTDLPPVITDAPPMTDSPLTTTAAPPTVPTSKCVPLATGIPDLIFPP